jgi:hypothetical protein
MMFRLRAFLPPPLFLLCVLAAWAAYEGLSALYPEPGQFSHQSLSNSAADTKHDAQITLPSWTDDFSDQDRDHPLFTPKRRRPEPPKQEPQEPDPAPELSPDPEPMPAPPPPPPPEPPNISYRGFVRISTEVSALIMDKLTGDERFVRQGDEIEGWRVEKINQTQIYLSLKTHRAVVKLSP